MAQDSRGREKGVWTNSVLGLWGVGQAIAQPVAQGEIPSL